jgi:hypothetical protein
MQMQQQVPKQILCEDDNKKGKGNNKKGKDNNKKGKDNNKKGKDNNKKGKDNNKCEKQVLRVAQDDIFIGSG